MCEYSGGQDDGRARRELHHQVAIPQNEMPTCLWIEVAEGGYRTPTKGKVGEVGVLEALRSWSEVVGGCCKYA